MEIMRRLKAQGKFSNSMLAEIKEDDRIVDMEIERTQDIIEEIQEQILELYEVLLIHVDQLRIIGMRK